MVEIINKIVTAVSDILYRPWCVPLILLAGGIIMTLRSGFVQIRLIKESVKVVMEKPKSANIGAFLKQVSQTLTKIQQAGISAVSERKETEKEIVLTITIPK